MAGYSGTPLAKKLGIREGSRIYLFGAPRNYWEMLAPLPENVQAVAQIDQDTDLIHIFSTEQVELASVLRTTLEKMSPNTAIWVSWPKKSSKVPTDVTEDVIREIALPVSSTSRSARSTRSGRA